MKVWRLLVAGILCFAGSQRCPAQIKPVQSKPPSNSLFITPAVSSDGWCATDALGRKLPASKEAGPKRNNRQVAMFYWTWHCEPMTDYASVGNISEILRKYPEALNDTKHPAWDRGNGNTHFWEQPLFGYYRTTDPWVLRKHAELLADAGVDAVFLDCTNAPFTWKSSYDVMFRVWHQARLDGVRVPKIAFMLPFGPGEKARLMLRDLYQDLYEPKRYPDLWFSWLGKPVIMAYPESLPASGDSTDRAISRFFTFRPGQPDYVNGPSKKHNQWGWLEVYPQHKFMERPDGTCEEVTVGVAQNAGPLTRGHCSAFNLPGTYGRSYTFHNGQDTRPAAYLYGLNFQEQWDRALELDPELVFVTGWNEFVAGKWEKGSGWTGEPFSFVDEFDWEHSRDIEPNKGWGDKGDVYYYQLVSNIRKYKGMDGQEAVSGPVSAGFGNFSGWEKIQPEYRHYRGNTLHRDHPGHAGTRYVNNSGRNDIVSARVARDREYVWFYVETEQPLTLPGNNDHWMWLFLDIDRNKSTGWEGYDFLVNLVPPKGGKGRIARSASNGWEWNFADNYSVKTEGNKMEIKVSRKSLGIKGENFSFEFKWCDNVQEPGNIMDFYSSGDAAPGGRFNFLYSTNPK